MNKKDISDLIVKYEQMIRSGRSIYFDAEEFDELAEYYDILDNVDEAKRIVETGLKIHPGNQFLLMKKAKFMMYAGDYQKAFDYLNNTFSEYDFELYLLKIECLLQLGLYAEANLLTEEVLKDEQNEEDIIFSELGFIYGEADYYDDAIQLFEQSLQSNPQNIEVLTELSYAYEMCSDYAAAITASNRILDVDPYSYDAWVNIGKLYSLQDEFEKAIDAFDFALTINDTDPDLLKLKAHCLSLCGEIEQAIEIFKECIADNSYDKSLYYSLAECYFSMEQYDDMLDCLDKYEELNGESAEIYAKKALIHLQKQDIEESHRLLEAGLLLDPDSEDLNIVAGEFYFQTGDHTRAELFFLNAYNQNANNIAVLDKLSLLSISQGDIDDAILYTEKLVALNPLGIIRTRLVLLYFEADDKQKFNDYLDSFSDEELRSLMGLFFSEEQFDLSSINRKTLIDRLNDARECRQLFKNIAY